MEKGSADKLWTLGFLNLLAFDTIYQFGAYMTNSIISVYAVALGATYAVAGLLAGMNPGTSMAVRPITGFVADLLSKKTLLVLCAILFFAATLGCAVFESFVLLGACRVLQGASFALRSACVVSLTARVVPKSRLATGMGWLGLSSIIANAVGPMIGETVGQAFGYSTSFLLTSGLLLVGLALAVAFRMPKDASAVSTAKKPITLTKLKDAFHVKNFLYKPSIPLTIMAGLSGIPMGISIALVILAAEQRGIEGATLYFTFYAVAAFVAKPLMGRVTDAVGAGKVTVPLLLTELAGVFVLAFMADTWMVALGGALIGIGQGSVYSVLQAESVRNVDPSEAGRAANTFYIGPDINMCTSPIIGSILLDTFGVTALYSYAALAMLTCIGIFVWRESGKSNK